MTDAKSSSLRARLPKIFTKSSTSYGTDMASLVRIVKTNHPKADLTVIEKAFQFAEKYHTGSYGKVAKSTSLTLWLWGEFLPTWAQDPQQSLLPYSTTP